MHRRMLLPPQLAPYYAGVPDVLVRTLRRDRQELSEGRQPHRVQHRHPQGVQEIRLIHDLRL